MIETLNTTAMRLNADTVAIEFFGVVVQPALLAAFEEDEDQEEPLEPDYDDDDLDDDEFDDDGLDDDDEDGEADEENDNA